MFPQKALEEDLLQDSLLASGSSLAFGDIIIFAQPCPCVHVCLYIHISHCYKDTSCTG